MSRDTHPTKLRGPTPCNCLEAPEALLCDQCAADAEGDRQWDEFTDGERPHPLTGKMVWED